MQRALIPGLVVIGSFILFVLFLTGLIETSIQLYGPKGSVNNYCNLYRPVKGSSQATLAYLETLGICKFMLYSAAVVMDANLNQVMTGRLPSHC